MAGNAVYALYDFPCLQGLSPADSAWKPTVEGIIAFFDDKEPKDNPHADDPEATKAWFAGFVSGTVASEFLRANLLEWIDSQECQL